jgi:hypothetical protein
MLVQFTGFSPVDRNYDEEVVIESKAIVSVVGSKTGDRQSYTTILTETGTYTVKESVREVLDKCGTSS